jgi:hypothetical protein
MMIFSISKTFGIPHILNIINQAIEREILDIPQPINFKPKENIN